MKKRNSVLLILILSIFFTNSFLIAQVSEAEAKETIKSLFDSCKKNDFRASSNLLVYFGNDNSRVDKDFFNSNNPDELKEVKRICKKVNAILLISDSYSFGKFRDRIINGKKYQSLDVIFLSGKQKVKEKVLFTKINGKPAIFNFN